MAGFLFATFSTSHDWFCCNSPWRTFFSLATKILSSVLAQDRPSNFRATYVLARKRGWSVQDLASSYCIDPVTGLSCCINQGNRPICFKRPQQTMYWLRNEILGCYTGPGSIHRQNHLNDNCSTIYSAGKAFG